MQNFQRNSDRLIFLKIPEIVIRNFLNFTAFKSANLTVILWILVLVKNCARKQLPGSFL